jgi:CRP-like cAMP-binding protein
VALGHPRSWERGEILVRAGDPADTAIVMLSGVAKVHAHSADGSEVVLNLCGPGDLLGEVTAVRNTQRSATATALQPVSASVLRIPEVRSFLSGHPRASLALLDLALARLHRADAHRLEFAAADTLGRVARRLVELAERFGEPGADGTIEVGLAIPQDDIAAWSAASRESTARALRTLRQLHLIESHRLRLTIVDVDRLRAHAAQL